VVEAVVELTAFNLVVGVVVVVVVAGQAGVVKAEAVEVLVVVQRLIVETMVE
jgi:hypothetical protein